MKKKRAGKTVKVLLWAIGIILAIFIVCYLLMLSGLRISFGGETEVSNEIKCDVPENMIVEPQVEETPKTEVQEEEIGLGVDEHKLDRGESVIVNSKEVKLIDFGTFTDKLEIKISVDDKEWIIYNTKYVEIVNGLKISVLEITPATAPEQYAILEIEPSVLETNQYLIRVEDAGMRIKGKKVFLYEVSDFGTIKVYVDDTSTTISAGDSKTFEGLKITNVNSFPRARRSEEYAIIKIE